MKTLKPLAAALLLLASPAAAQLLAGPSGGGFNFGGTGSLASQAAPVTDFTFRCGTPPWKACTDVEMNQRQLILITRKCPAPVSNACSSWLMANTDAGAVELLGTRPDVQWEDPVHCNFIPCRTVNSPKGPDAAPAAAPRPVAASSSYEDEPGFIGPPSPFRASNAPVMSDAQFQQAFDAAKKEHGKDAIDLGNKRYGVLHNDGTIDVCGADSCSQRPQSEFADQIQMARNESFSFNGASGGGQTNSGAPTTPGPNNSGRTNGSPNPADETSSPSDEARGSGNDAGNFFRSGSDGSGSGSGSGAGGSEGYAAAGKDQVIKTKAAELDGVYTYNKTQEIKATIEKTAGAVTGGVDGTFATPTNTPDANAGDLQFKGTQSGSNQ